MISEMHGPAIKQAELLFDSDKIEKLNISISNDHTHVLYGASKFK